MRWRRRKKKQQEAMFIQIKTLGMLLPVPVLRMLLRGESQNRRGVLLS